MFVLVASAGADGVGSVLPLAVGVLVEQQGKPAVSCLVFSLWRREEACSCVCFVHRLLLELHTISLQPTGDSGALYTSFVSGDARFVCEGRHPDTNKRTLLNSYASTHMFIFAWRCIACMQTGAVVRVGPVQHLAFVEGEEAMPEEYDGHHICVYLTEEGGRHYTRAFGPALVATKFSRETKFMF